MLREVMSSQRKTRMDLFKLTGTGTAALGEGKYAGTLVDNGTGDYTITFIKPFARTPLAFVSSLTAGIQIKIHAISKTAIQIKSFAVDGTTATDAVLDLAVVGFDAEDQNA